MIAGSPIDCTSNVKAYHPTSQAQRSDAHVRAEQRGSAWPAPLAGRLTSDEAAPEVADTVVAIWLEIDQALHPIIGHRGVAALYDRSLNLTAGRLPLAGRATRRAGRRRPTALKAALAQQARRRRCRWRRAVPVVP